MEDTRFDALLRTAAADAARDDLQTANLQRAPRRARKPLRVFIAAAACVALLTTGVAAAWSRTVSSSPRPALRAAVRSRRSILTRCPKAPPWSKKPRPKSMR